jgi:hypothetical protein
MLPSGYVTRMRTGNPRTCSVRLIGKPWSVSSIGNFPLQSVKNQRLIR